MFAGICDELARCGNVSQRYLVFCGAVVVDWFLNSLVEQLLFDHSIRCLCLFETISDVDLFQRPGNVRSTARDCIVYGRGASLFPGSGSYN